MMETVIPRAFFWRRMHSLMGLWLVLFLIEHLFTNSQAALWFGNDPSGFIRAVDEIKNLPYLFEIELLLLGVPFLIHMIWGIKYLFTGKMNSMRSDGTSPSLSQYPANHAYTWQRITAWILVIGILGHVTQMRFIDYPGVQKLENHDFYKVRLKDDAGLESLASRFNVKLEYGKLNENQVIAVAPDFGTAELFLVRETFKMPLMVILYSLFVLAATFHAFQGLWTFLITWGISLSERGRNIMRKITLFLMAVLTLLGFTAIWGTYLVT